MRSGIRWTAAGKRDDRKSICCGYETADKIMDQTGTSNPREIAGKLGLRVEYLDKGQIADRVLFALLPLPT